MTTRAYGLLGVLLVLTLWLVVSTTCAAQVPVTVVLQDLCSGYRLSRVGNKIDILCPTRRGWVRQASIVGLCTNDFPPKAYYKRDDVRFACAHDPNPYWSTPTGPRRWEMYALPKVRW